MRLVAPMLVFARPLNPVGGETTILARLVRAARRAHEVWAELDHAQRRLLELQTGVALVKPEQRPGICSRVEELEALYLYEAPGSDHDEPA